MEYECIQIMQIGQWFIADARSRNSSLFYLLINDESTNLEYKNNKNISQNMININPNEKVHTYGLHYTMILKMLAACTVGY